MARRNLKLHKIMKISGRAGTTAEGRFQENGMKASAEGRVIAVERFAKVFTVQMGIDLGSGDAFMAEHFLDGAQIGASFDEVGGEGMPEGMRRDIFGYAGLPDEVFEEQEDHYPGELAAPAV